ncbi:MAG: tryptophan 2,3-dioxygenase [Rhodobacteraceae bacterium]|nr:tryptophan 2,3-dioxygenase [Paracoccaceae bacterium]
MAYDPANEGAKMSFAADMSYGDYLGLDKVLSAQDTLSDAHDELLFIIQHQTSELWMKLALHELRSAREMIRAGTLRPCFKILSRLARIFEQLNGAWDVLRTMTPSDYTRFRESLGASSGFQSYQYRLIEFVLGNRNLAMTRVHEHRADIMDLLSAELAQPSLYDEAIRFAANRLGVSSAELPDPKLDMPHVADDRIMAIWQRVYEAPEAHWEVYELAEKLVDLEDYFRRWRFNHVTTVERVIGFKRGTGGTAGVAYLRRMLEVELFPELWNVRGNL